MALFEVTNPETNEVYQVEAPDDATNEELNTQFQKYLTSQAASTVTSTAPRIVTDPAELNQIALIEKQQRDARELQLSEQQAADDSGFLSNVAGDLTSRVQNITQTNEDFEDGLIFKAERDFRNAGQFAAGASDIVGESLVLATKGVSFLIPDSIEDPVKQAAATGFSAIMSTSLGEEAKNVLQGTIEDYKDWASSNPRKSKMLEAVVNIGVWFSPAKAKLDAAPVDKIRPTMIQRVANTVAKSADGTILKRGKKKAATLIMPVVKDPLKTDEQTFPFPRKVNPITKRLDPTTGAGYKYNIDVIDQNQQKIIDDLGSLDIPINTSYQGSLNRVQQAISEEAESLLSKLIKSSAMSVVPETAGNRVISGKVDIDNRITQQEVENVINTSVNNLLEQDLFVSANELTKTVNIIRDKAIKIFATKSETPVGLLQARMELDTWLKAYKPPQQVYQQIDNVETALTSATTSVRIAMNDLISTKAPNAGLKRSLEFQSNLYRAMNPIVEKASAEFNTSAGRLWQNVTRTGVKLPTTPLAQLATVSAASGLLGLALNSVVYAVIPAVAGFSAVKATMSASTRKGLYKLLLAADKAIRISTNKETILQLKMERQAVLELLKETTEEKEEQTNKEK